MQSCAGIVSNESCRKIVVNVWDIAQRSEYRRGIPTVCVGCANLLRYIHCGSLAELQLRPEMIGIGAGDLSVGKHDELDLKLNLGRLVIAVRPRSCCDEATARQDVVD